MKTSFFRSAATTGLFIGLCLILHSVLDWSFGFYGQKFAFSVLAYAIMIAGLLWGAIRYRNQELGGYISYGNALSFSVVVAIFYTLTSLIFGLILTQIIDPDYSSKVMEFAEQKLYDRGLSQAQIDMAMEMSSRFTKPAISAVLGFFGAMILSTIFALITSAFVQRNKSKNNPFE